MIVAVIVIQIQLDGHSPTPIVRTPVIGGQEKRDGIALQYISLGILLQQHISIGVTQ
jgi:hypothetical protein